MSFHGCNSLSFAGFIPAAILFAGIAAQPAAAQSAAANVETYCTQKYGAGTLATFDRRDNGAMCSEKTSQGLGLLHHKINPADICTAQQNTSQFRLEGRQILCLTGNETIAPDRKVDLGDFCRRNYGQSAIVSKRLTDNQPLCTAKGTGGLSQMHHAIDLAQLCGVGGKVSPAAVEGDTLDCAKRGVAAAGTGSAGKAGSANGAGKGKSPSGEQTPSSPKQAGANSQVPETAIIPFLEDLHLADCGVVWPPRWYFERPEKAVRDAYLGKNKSSPWQTGRGAVPCSSFTGGFVPDLTAYCRKYWKSPGAWLEDGRPVCIPPNYPAEQMDALALPLWPICFLMHPNPEKILRGEEGSSGNGVALGHLVPIVKFTPGRLECFYVEMGSTFWADDMK